MISLGQHYGIEQLLPTPDLNEPLGGLAVTRFGAGVPSEGNLEDLLRQSQEFLRADPKAAKQVFRANTESFVAGRRAQEAEAAIPYRDTARLRKRAGALSARMEETPPAPSQAPTGALPEGAPVGKGRRVRGRQFTPEQIEAQRARGPKNVFEELTPAQRGALKQAEKLVRLEVLEFLTPSAIFFTDQVGFSKPNPKLYRRVLQRLDLKPQRCLYVGDNPTHDIDPCNREGWSTVRIRRGGRHAAEEGATVPTHEIKDFRELERVLQDNYEFA